MVSVHHIPKICLHSNFQAGRLNSGCTIQPRRLPVIKLICALGNPGREYSATRHNAGWIFLGHWQPGLEWQKKFKGEYAVLHQPRKLIFLKPLSFMNNSGESVRACADFFSLEAEEILVIHDDLELPFGEVVCKKGGGLGGHNGLKSVNQHLGTKDFHRLRLGIGRPERGSVSNYVLARFSREEEAELPLVFRKGIDIMQHSLD